MLKWFRGKTKSVQNTAGLTDQELALLIEDMGRLRQVRKDLPERALRYVVDGEGAEVLRDLQRISQCGAAMVVSPASPEWPHNFWTKGEGDARWRFFQTTQTATPELIFRLAQVYEAAADASYSPFQPCPNAPNWMLVLVREATGHCNPWSGEGPPNARFRAEKIEQVGVAAGLTPDAVMTAAFTLDAEYLGDWNKDALSFTWLAGFGERVAVHADAVREALAHIKACQRSHALHVLARSGAAIEPFAQTIVDLAVSSSRKVRDAAEPILESNRELFTPLLESKGASRKQDERALAAGPLWKLNGTKSKPVLEKWLRAEKSDKVREQLASLMEVSVAAAEAKPTSFDLPPVHPVQAKSPLTPAAEAAYHKFFAEHARCHQLMVEEEKKRGAIPTTSNATRQRIMGGIAFLVGDASFVDEKDYRERLRIGVDSRLEQQVTKAAVEFAACPDVELVHLVRLVVLLGMFPIHPFNSFFGDGLFDSCLQAFEASHKRKVCLREIAVALDATGIGSDGVGWTRLQEYGRRFVIDEELTWPYFAERPQFLEAVIVKRGRQIEGRDYFFAAATKPERLKALEVLSAFPQPPAQLVPTLWDLALGSSYERDLAVKCLNKLPEAKGRIVGALKHRKTDARASAARWLADLGASEAVPEIQAALEVETAQSARVALTDALHVLTGAADSEAPAAADLDAWLNDAEAGLKTGIPDALSWFPFDALPTVRLATGEQVPREVLVWKIVQQYQVGKPEPGPALVSFASLLDPGDRQAFGLFVLQQWLDHDAKPVYTEAQARAIAQQEAPKWARSPYYTYESAYRELYNSHLRMVEGSAIKEKGILAVAGACAGALAAEPVRKYLDRFYGFRVVQCKAMLWMLSWVDHPTATQLLIKVAGGFRTRGIQDEAVKCVEALAQRKGWSMDELADRTVPTGGFDSDAQMTLDYGGRSFVAKVNAKLGIDLYTAEGKSIKALPDAAAGDSPDLVKEAKKLLSDARKEVKSALKLQKDRLYEAVCTQRTWRFEDWDLYVNRHPILRHYCQRLVWASGEVTFRPLDDGTLTDSQDQQATLPPDALIHLAHSVSTPEDVRRQWMKHFKDYEVEPLLEQFTKPVYELPQDKWQDMEVRDFEGHILEPRKFRTRAEKLGYSHSQAEDGGCFYYHTKAFSGLGIDAVIESTPICIVYYEGTPPAALLNLHFVRSGSQGKLFLKDIPPVVLSECWNDTRLIAAEGAGFDKDWRSKTGYF